MCVWAVVGLHHLLFIEIQHQKNIEIFDKKINANKNRWKGKYTAEMCESFSFFVLRTYRLYQKS